MVALLVALGLLASYPMGVFVMALIAAPRPQAAAAPAVSGSGVVLSMNDAMGTISIQHTGVPLLNLAPGVTAFPAAAPVFKRIEVGDQLSFRLSQQGGVYVISSADNGATAVDATPRR